MKPIVSFLVVVLILSLGPASGVPFRGYDERQLYQSQRMMPLSKNLTLHERIEFSDDCQAIGTDCQLAEQCCTKVCLVMTMRCSIP
ncbi:uncharacterized protein LOC117585561 [Drosophila guanche]|uniref:uncharacterized protein LOC117585561 n=1 Tax=Drosophila guanche TaxID=7266 RepID=UPI001470C2D6|nr:uncharacterized protein LOC117585561 [Drosophila guanche]